MWINIVFQKAVPYNMNCRDAVDAPGQAIDNRLIAREGHTGIDIAYRPPAQYN